MATTGRGGGGSGDLALQKWGAEQALVILKGGGHKQF